MTYDEVISAIEAAGFYCERQDHRNGPRLICASRLRGDGSGYCGNSFWMAERDGTWYIGHWSSRWYVLPDPERAAAFCIEWFTRVPNKLPYDFDDHMKAEYALRPIFAEEAPESLSWPSDEENGGGAPVWPGEPL